MIDKCGSGSIQNYYFLLFVYMNAIKDTVRVSLGSKIRSTDKLNYLHKIRTDQRTKKLNQASFPQMASERQKLYAQVPEWIYRQQIVRGKAGMEIAADIFVSMNLYPTEITSWKNCRVFLLLTKIRGHTIEAAVGRRRKGNSFRCFRFVTSVRTKRRFPILVSAILCS